MGGLAHSEAVRPGGRRVSPCARPSKITISESALSGWRTAKLCDSVAAGFHPAPARPNSG